MNEVRCYYRPTELLRESNAWNGEISSEPILVKVTASLDVVNLLRFPFAGGQPVGFPNVVSRMLKQDKRLVNSRTKYGDTPLHVAVESGQTEIVEFLLQNGADSSSQNQSGKLPIELVRDPFALRLLLARNPSQRDAAWKEIINRAIRFADSVFKVTESASLPGMVQVLVHAGCKHNHYSAILTGDLELVTQVAPGILAADCDRALRLAVATGHIEIAQYLLDRFEIDITSLALKGSLISLAVRRREMTQLMIDRGANLNITFAEGHWSGSFPWEMTARPLHYAAAFGTPDTIQLLFNHGATLTTDRQEDMNALAVALHEGRFDNYFALVGSTQFKRLDIATQNTLVYNPHQPVDWIADSRKLPVIRRMTGIDVFYPVLNLGGALPQFPFQTMDAAIRVGREDVVNALLANGYQSSTQWSDEISLAVACGRLRMLEAFFGRASPVELDSNHLVVAAENGHVAVLRWLLNYGIDPSWKDERNKTALDAARENSYGVTTPECERLLDKQ